MEATKNGLKMHRIMKKYITILLLLVSFFAFGQKPQGLVSYQVKVLGKDYTQGQWITVVYILEATNYEVGDVSTEDGIHLETFNQSKSTFKGVHRLATSCTYSLTGIGPTVIPRLDVKVDGVPVEAEPTVIDVKPNAKYGEEWKMARAFLLARGVNPRHLSARYSASTLVAFSDESSDAFAIMATKDYAIFMDNPILAYGIGNSMWDGSSAGGDNTVYHILGQYDAQLRLLREKGVSYHSLPYTVTGKRQEGVAPLLDAGLNYGQRSPYNRLFPKERLNGRDSTCLAGCGPVALAQVLSFHKADAAPTGVGRLRTIESKKEYDVDLGDHPFGWTGGDADLASLLLCSAASVYAEIDPRGTSSSLVNFKGALINHWNYSPTCTYVPKRPDLEMLGMIYSELDQGRPVIVADAAHIFVCDGYFEDFLHLNLGWNGYCNGYYRAIVITSDHRRQLPFNEILIGIKPLLENENLELSVKVKKVSTLGDVIEKAMRKKKNLGREIVSLKVSGNINGKDIALLRRMAGAAAFGRHQGSTGSLMDLDLSDANIIGGGYYITQSANKMIFSGTVPSGVPYRYDMSHLGPGQWEEMQALGLTNGPSWVIQPDGAGGFSVSWKAVENVVGPHMFEDCQNLRTLKLPKNTREVGSNAFFGCRALMQVDGLPADTAQNAFDNTLLQ